MHALYTNVNGVVNKMCTLIISIHTLKGVFFFILGRVFLYSLYFATSFATVIVSNRLRKEMRSPGVRKGAWSGEEDELLRRCIELHGEGKWHLVPQRAGLNRCRKSCRLRWLNYLRPNLNREEFKEDEIDLIFKMHKLLGNRWSLIAGRIPGRTANDIKNYWNSHLSKQLCSKQNESPRQSLKRKRHEVLRPQPRSFNIKVPSQGPVESDIVKTKQQQQQQEEEEKQHLRWSKLLLEDDMDSGENPYNINEGLFKDSLCVGMEPEAVRFDCSAVEWEDLLVINDWLIK